MRSTYRFFLATTAICSAVFAPAQYARNNVRFLSQIALTGFPGSPTSGSGCAGYVSPSGKEYAIMGLRNGNAVVNITNPTLPVIVGHVPGVVSQWHEVCVLGDYAYATTEGGGGIQIIDLRQVDQGIVTLAATYTGGAVSSGHTIQAVPEKKLVIINGGNGISGLRALDCTNPIAPVEVGTWTTKYVHDAIYKTYTTGPNAGKTICFAFCGNGALGGMYIIDITNPASMTTLGFIRYITTATNFYSHSGSMSPDGRFILANDELDESNGIVTNCTTHIINIENLSAPTYAGSFLNAIGSIDHNSMVQDGHLYLSAYTSGMRVYDVRNTPTVTETGFFDTFPAGSGYSFAGDWGVWAAFPSGNVILSDMNRGLFVVDPSEAKGLGAPITNVKYQNVSALPDAVKRVRKEDAMAFPADFTLTGAGLLTVHQSDSIARTMVDVKVRARSRNNRQETMFVYASRRGNKPLLIGTWQLTGAYTDYSVSSLSGATHLELDGSLEITLEFLKGPTGDGAVDIDLVKTSVHN